MDSSDEWTEVLKGESCFATADFDAAERAYRRAATLTSSPKPLRSGADQLEIFASVLFQPTQATQFAALLRELASTLMATSGTTGASVGLKKRDSLPAIMHLSDLHFGSKTANGESMHRFFDGENSESLSRHLCDEFSRSSGHFKIAPERLYLVISGDIGYRAVKQEFIDAKNTLDQICQGLAISKERVIIVPGNHDVNWMLSQDDLSQRFDHFLRFIFDFYGLELCKRKYPSIDWPLGYDKKHPHGHDIVSVHYDESHDILFLGLNSCVYESHQDHFGFIGAKQIKLAKKLVEESKASRSTVRIAVIHHHLHPFPERLDQRVPSEIWQDLSTIRDAGFVESALESLEIDFVLHGHKHKPQFRETIVRDPIDSESRKRLIVCGAGSVSCTELEDEEQNHYQVIELKRADRIRNMDFARLEWRSLSRKPGAEWVSTKAWDIPG
jgi:3',5'-cyclic AMP phosphodiesterase CpdA